MHADDSYSDALSRMAQVVGQANVQDDEKDLHRFAMSSSASSTRARAIVSPATKEELAAVVRIAARTRIPVYPVSTGHNWGYGDACPPSEGQVLLHLGRMNRISAYDEELGVVHLEPGVTQRQLSDYLHAHGDRWWMDCTGAGPDTSLIGNLAERGFGHSPYGNRMLHVSGLELVLANGELLETGFGHYPGARASQVYPYGVGPWLDGIFTQSNFGILAGAGFWLLPASEALNHFLCGVPQHEQVAAVVDALRPLRMDGTLRSVIHIGNDMRVLSGGMTFPHDAAPAQSCLPPALRASLCARSGIGAWTVSGALYGRPGQLVEARRALRKALARTGADIRFLTPSALAWGARAANWLGGSAMGARLRGRIALGQSLMAMNRGVPDARFLAGAYWRRRGGLPPGFPVGADPARDRCGLLWVSPVLPMRGAEMLAVHALAKPVFERHGFDLFATFSMINERALGGVLTIAFDADDNAESDRAHRCYDALFSRMMDSGYLPYRVGSYSMDRLDPLDDSYWHTVARIKAALDPDGILAPGRYEPAVASKAKRGAT